VNKFFAISLSILLLAVCCKDVGTYISFYANQDFIAKVLCIEKNEPKSCCAGKCYLTKQLAEGKSDKESPSPATQSEIKQLQYIPVVTDDLIVHTTDEVYTHDFHYLGIRATQVTDNLLRPPIAT